MKILKSIRLNLSCYCCGSIDFEVKEMKWHEIEGMSFLYNEDKQMVKCSKCGLEDYLSNLVPRGFLHEELIEM